MTLLEFALGIGIPTPVGQSPAYEYPTLSIPASTPQVIDLLDARFGYTILDNQGNTDWMPARPDLKGGGDFRDPLSQDGRQLNSGVYSNVIETIPLNIMGDNQAILYKRLAALQRMITLAQKYASSEYQAQPVWLKWFPSGAARAGYSRVENVSMAVQSMKSSPFSMNVTITLEREPEWWPIMPGQSPLLWYQMAQGNSPGVDYDYTDLAVGETSNFPYSATITNFQEFANAAIGGETYRKTRGGYSLDIPGADIPGEAPARVFILPASALNSQNFHIARDTRALDTVSAVDRYLTINGCDNEQGQFTVDSDGVYKYATASTNEYVCQLVSGSLTVSFGVLGLGSGFPEYSVHLFRGRHMVFIRGFQNAGNAGDVSLTLELVDDAGGAVTLENTAAWDSGNAGKPAITYMGTVKLPFKTREEMSVDTGVSGVNIGDQLQAFVTAALSGSATIYSLVDILFIPYDEYACSVYGGTIALDNTGYLDLGQRKDTGRGGGSYRAGNTYPAQEIRGSLPRLQPGVKNRLYFVTFTNAGVSEKISEDVYVCFVPGWYGPIDV